MHPTHVYIGPDPELKGRRGAIYTASGHYNRSSVEYQAFIFETEEGDVACYCDRSHVRLYHGEAAA